MKLNVQQIDRQLISRSFAGSRPFAGMTRIRF